MNLWLSKLTGIVSLVLVILYSMGFFGSYASYVLFALTELISKAPVPIKTFFGWVTVGASVSLLASLCAWPFALAITTLLEHNKARPHTRYFWGLIRYMASLPLLLFLFVYVEVVGATGFLYLKSGWVSLFATPNFFTKGLAFAFTLLFYPLTALPWFEDRLTIDLFYKEMLVVVLEFAEVGLVATVIALGLYLFILPKMILQMKRQLHNDKNLRNLEVVKSIGGTSWESLQLTLMQSMKERFNVIISHGSRLCFFEGIITFSLLNLFFFGKEGELFHWSASLSSIFIATSQNGALKEGLLVVAAGCLVLCYIVFFSLDRYFKKRIEVQGV